MTRHTTDAAATGLLRHAPQAGLLGPVSHFGGHVLNVLVGEDQTPFQIHQTALARLSPRLERITAIESHESRTWDELLGVISPETFTRFRDFAYSGDYTSPVLSQRPSDWERPSVQDARRPRRSTAADDERPPPVSDRYEIVDSRSPTRDDGPQRPAPARTPCPPARRGSRDINQPKSDPQASSASYDGDTEPDSIGEAFKRRTLLAEPATKDHTSRHTTAPPSEPADSIYWEPVLLAHAELYLFAGELGVAALRLLSLQRIHAILVDYQVTPDTVCDVIALVEFERRAEESRSVALRVDNELMAVLAQWFAWRVGRSGGSGFVGTQREFEELLASNWSFTREFWRSVCEWRLEG